MDGDLSEVIEDARLVLAGAQPSADATVGFARALVQVADACVVGLPCDRHGGAVHGQEAEELRAGVEQILRNTADVNDGGAAFVLAELRRSLIFLLDRIDARDSLSLLEATDPKEETEEAIVAPEVLP